MTIVQESTSVVQLPLRAAPRFRRRRVVAVLTTLVAAAALAAIGTQATWAWSALGVSLGLCVAYAVAYKRGQRQDLERQFQALIGDAGDFFAGVSDLAVAPEAEGEIRRVAPRVPAWRQAVALVRFLACYAAGWALAPLVFALTVAVGRTPRDTTGQRWLAQLQATQTRLRDGSMRTLAVTATATASVTAAGGVTLLAGAGAAGAAPAPVAAISVGIRTAVGVGIPTAATTSYTVQSGDTLSSIAARFATSWEALATDNHISDPNLIYPGQVLTIGGSASAATAPVSARASTYTVESGDTLSSVAARFGTTWEALAQINGLANPNFITVGEVLRLSGSATATSTSTATTTSGSGSSTTTAPASSAAQIAVRTALAQVGKPYVWGGAGPNDFDCSGLVMYAWAAAGVQLAHYTVSQYEETTRISQSQLEPGDLVFYDTGDGAQPGHVTMYIGNGQIVTADEPGTDIRVENLDWDGIPMGFGRVH